MSELTIDEQYAAELKQSDIDHHVPTAGAMTNHILSNLMVAYVKLTQVKWYVKGPQSLALRTAYQRLLDQNVRQFAELGELLLVDTENLFVDRAIKLAEKENRPALAAWLVAYRGSNNRNIRELQVYLGNDARTGLDEEDEDDDD